MGDPAVAAFQAEILEGCQILKKLGYWPAYFHREVANVGAVAAVRTLLDKPATSDGFARLWELGRLDLAVEAFVLLPWYEHLFTEVERRTARSRLVANGFDVDHYLAGAAPPGWWS